MFPSLHYVLGYQRSFGRCFIQCEGKPTVIDSAGRGADATSKLRAADKIDKLVELRSDIDARGAHRGVGKSDWHDVKGLWCARRGIPAGTDTKPDAPTYGPPEFGRRVSELGMQSYLVGLPWPIGGVQERVGRGLAMGRTTLLLGNAADGLGLLGRRFVRDGLCAEYQSDDRPEDVLVVSFGLTPGLDIRGRISQLVRKHFQDCWARNTQGIDAFRDLKREACSYQTAQSYQDQSSIQVRERMSRLTIIEQKPGMVTPDEFLHRLVYWLGVRPVGRVLIRGVHEFSTLYPRLAEARLFFPAVLDLCQQYGTTTMVSAIEEESSEEREGLGLRALAETVVRVGAYGEKWRNVDQALADSTPTDASLSLREPPTLRSAAGEVDTSRRILRLRLKVEKIIRAGTPMTEEMPVHFERLIGDPVWRWVPEQQLLENVLPLRSV